MNHVKKSLFQTTFKQSNSYFFAIIRRTQVPLLILFIIGFSFKAYIYLTLKNASIDTGIDFDSLGTFEIELVLVTILDQFSYFIYTVQKFIPTLFFFFLFFIIPPRITNHINNQPNTPLCTVLKHYTAPLTIESLRVTFFIFLWSLLFIIPGLIKSVLYYFVPYIVLFDPRYKKDLSFDPLKESQSLIKNSFFKFLGLQAVVFSCLLALYLVIEIPIEYLASGFNNPDLLLLGGQALTTVLDLLLQVYFHIFFLMLYFQMRKKPE